MRGSVGISPALADRLKTAKTEANVPIALLDNAVGRYRQLVFNPRQLLDEERGPGPHTQALLADLLGSVLIGADAGETWAE
jgi:hypothetical protein